MKPLRMLSLVVLAVSLTSCATRSGDPPNVTNGELDLGGWNPTALPSIPLAGNWQFFASRLAADYPDEAPTLAPVPGKWRGLRGADGRELGDHGFGTYRVRLSGLPVGSVLSVSVSEEVSAYRLFVLPGSTNGIVTSATRALLSNGVVGRSPETTIPQYAPRSATFIVTESTEYLVVELSNFATRDGGMSNPPVLSTPGAAARSSLLESSVSYFSLGVIFFMGLHYFVFFVVRRRERSAILFALFCFGLGIRQIMTERLMQIWWFPDPSLLVFNVTSKIEFLTVYLLAPIFYQFMQRVYPAVFRTIVTKILWGIAALYTGFTLVTSLDLFVRVLLYYQLLIVVVGIYIVYGMIRAAIRREPGTIPGLIGFLVFFASAVNDILASNLVVHTPFLLAYGFLAFLFSQSLLLSVNYNGAMERVESLNRSLFRFVPREFIHYLGKESILDVQLGDASRRDMTVLFADIRSFSTLSERLTPEESFRFLNSYLQRVGPIIRAHRGYIDKYIGDGIMALFPEQAEDAVACAVDMFAAVLLYNEHRVRSGYVPIRIGVGVHTGSIVLGTIGENERIDGTVIADAVNVSSRLEGLNKVFGSSLIITDEIRRLLADPDRYLSRMLGNVIVKGRREPVVIHEILIPDVTPGLRLKLESKEAFARAVELYAGRHFYAAGRMFHDLLAANPDDAAAAYYLDRCEELSKLASDIEATEL